MESHLQTQDDQCFAKGQSRAENGPQTLGSPEDTRSLRLTEQHTEAFTLGSFQAEKVPDVKTLIDGSLWSVSLYPRGGEKIATKDLKGKSVPGPMFCVYR